MKRISIFALICLVCAWFGNISISNARPFAPQDTEFEAADDESDEQTAIEETLTEAITSIRKGEYEEGISVVRKLRKEHHENPEVAMTLVQVLQAVAMKISEDDRPAANKYYYEAGEVVRELSKQFDKLPEDAGELLAVSFYNEACAHAVDGNSERALKSLKEAFEAGFDDFAAAEGDKDFAEIGESVEFKTLLEEQRKLAAVRLHERTQKEINNFESFDFDFDVVDVQGKAVKKSDFEGKLLIVDFWGTWCPPCRAEIPSFIKLKKEYADKLDVVGFAFERTDDEEEAAEIVSEFMSDNEMSYSSVIGNDEIADQVPDLRAFPTTLFVDGSGKVRLMMVGFRSYEELESAVKILTDKNSGSR
jgi:thiol-disulfide isomerase/thioredoxin